MKTKIIILAVSLIFTTIALAIPVLPFPGWEEIKQKSSDIIIARCVETTDNPVEEKKDGMLFITRGLIKSDIQVIYALKGQTIITSAKLNSLYWPRRGEEYAIFATLQGETYDATETYRIIPLGTHFPNNSLIGKTLDEQIQMIFQWRLNHLSQELVQLNDEKSRLENIPQKPK